MDGRTECGQIYSHSPEMMIEGPMGNVYFRPMRFEQKGEMTLGHKHNFDHVTFLWHGSVRLRAWQGSQDAPEVVPVDRQYAAPSRILIRREWFHEITALENQSYADCIYAVRDFDGNVTDTWNGSPEPYR